MAQETSRHCPLCEEHRLSGMDQIGPNTPWHWHYCAISPTVGPGAHQFITAQLGYPEGFRVQLPLQSNDHGKLMIEVNGFQWQKEIHLGDYRRSGFTFIGTVRKPGEFGNCTIIGWYSTKEQIIGYRLQSQQ